MLRVGHSDAEPFQRGRLRGEAVLLSREGRGPANSSERETRLSMLAAMTIDKGDLAETVAFARDLLAHVQAERRGR